MLVSAVQRSESALCTHKSLPVWTSLPLPYPTHPGDYRAPSWAPCAGSHYLSALHMDVHMPEGELGREIDSSAIYFYSQGWDSALTLCSSSLLLRESPHWSLPPSSPFLWALHMRGTESGGVCPWAQLYGCMSEDFQARQLPFSYVSLKEVLLHGVFFSWKLPFIFSLIKE